MNAYDLLVRLAESDIFIFVSHGKIKVLDPMGQMTAEDRLAVNAVRDQIPDALLDTTPAPLDSRRDIDDEQHVLDGGAWEALLLIAYRIDATDTAGMYGCLRYLRARGATMEFDRAIDGIRLIQPTDVTEAEMNELLAPWEGRLKGMLHELATTMPSSQQEVA